MRLSEQRLPRQITGGWRTHSRDRPYPQLQSCSRNSDWEHENQQCLLHASRIQQPSDLWDLEHYLTERRKQINRTYDYRYSQLTLVFGKLLCQSWLGEEELRGLGEDKLKSIRSYAKFLAEMAAA